MQQPARCPLHSLAAALLVASAVVHQSLRRKRHCKRRQNAGDGNDEDDGEVQQVLDFWFDGDLSTNYHTKWFPGKSAKQQAETDAEITRRFQPLLHSAVQGRLVHWEEAPRSLLALIVLCDQFSRHIFRHDRQHPDMQAADRLALRCAELMLARDWGRLLSIPEQIFSLMPLRHAPTVERLEIVMQEIDARAAHEQEFHDLLQKFKKTSFRELQHLQDRARVLADAEILEQAPFKADETNLLNEKLAQTVEQFIRIQQDAAHDSHDGEQAAEAKEGEVDGAARRFPVVISLSGGVDSMVLLKIAVALRDKLHLDVFAAHVDYGNREESVLEAEFLQQWCDDCGVRLWVRRVTEVRRGVTHREEYEEVSRAIRYNLYKEVMAATGATAVMFGHHQGDVQENVISNAMHGESPLHLSGMQQVGEVLGVHIWRPMLPYPKSVIYAFSEEYGVPYFKDTTPSWSTRGKLRNNLIPLLQEIYGGCLDNVSRLAAASDELREMVESNIYQPFMDQVVAGRMGAIFPVTPFRHQKTIFWKEVLKRVVHNHLGLGQIPDKALAVFLRRVAQIGTSKHKDGWMELKKEYYSYLQGDHVVLLRLEIVCDVQPFIGIRLDLSTTTSSSIQIGIWTASAEIISTVRWDDKAVGGNEDDQADTARQPRNPLDKDARKLLPAEYFRPIGQPSDFVHGAFSYFVVLPVELHHLEVTGAFDFPPFVQLDLKLRKGIPFLVAPEGAKDIASSGYHLVQVNYQVA